MTKSKQLTEENIVAINLAIAEQFNSEFSITRPHNVKLIVKQFNQLADKPQAYRYGYIANSIARLKPFKTNNTRTALAILLQSTKVPKANIPSLAGMLKHGADTEHISNLLVKK